MHTILERRRFTFHALLILVPLLVLTAVGLISLQREKKVAGQEALGKAEGLAHEMAAKVRQALQESRSDGSTESLRLGANGMLLAPSFYKMIPSPAPFDLEELNPVQRGLWDHAVLNKFAAQATDAFLESAPPARFRVWALMEAQALVQPVEAVKGLQNARSLAAGYQSESGLPISALIDLGLLERSFESGQDTVATLVLRNVLHEPSALSGLILQRAAQLKWPSEKEVATAKAQWAKDERMRGIYRALLATSGSLRHATWVDSALALPIAGQEQMEVFIFDANQLRDRLVAALRPSVLPPYFGAKIEIAGRDVQLFPPPRYTGEQSTKAGGPRRAVFDPSLLAPIAMASAEETVWDCPVVARIYLTDPVLLYRQQRERFYWFALVIGLSAVAATAGISASGKSLKKQVELNELQANFVSSVTHELRAPLASVRLLAEGLDRGQVTDPEKQREYYRFIVQECRRLSSLIENVLSYAQLEAGKSSFDFELTDVTYLIHTAAKAITPCADERQITLSVEAEPDLLHPSADGGALQQALINLLDNAIKHSPPGSAVSVIGRQMPPGPQNESRIEIAVADHGPGVPPGERRKIFERFYRLGSELCRETPGVGIGLSLVKHIVEAHGGEVLVESPPDGGSRFIIRLPIVHAEKTDESLRASK